MWFIYIFYAATDMDTMFHWSDLIKLQQPCSDMLWASLNYALQGHQESTLRQFRYVNLKFMAWSTNFA